MKDFKKILIIAALVVGLFLGIHFDLIGWWETSPNYKVNKLTGHIYKWLGSDQGWIRDR